MIGVPASIEVASEHVTLTETLQVETPLRLMHGGVLPRWQLGYRFHGRLDAPVVLILGGISADRHVNAASAGELPGWWEFAVGTGRAIDTQRYAVLSIDWLAGAGDSSGPDGASSTYEFPSIDTHDQAAAVAGMMRHLGIDQLYGAVGASYGGMVVLSLCERFPHLVQRAIVISAAHESHPMATALRVIQREAVKLGVATGRSREGLRIARALAMTTYRTAAEFATRFSGAAHFNGEEWRFPVQSYLEHHGDRFVERFSAERFLILSESNDLHRVIPESVSTPVTVIGVESDTLVPPWQSRNLARLLPRCDACHIVPSVYGHDAFLKESAIIAHAAAALDREVAL